MEFTLKKKSLHRDFSDLVSKMPSREVLSKNETTSLFSQQKYNFEVDIALLQPLSWHVIRKFVWNPSQLKGFVLKLIEVAFFQPLI